MGKPSKEDIAKKVLTDYMAGKGSLTALSRKYGISRERVWGWRRKWLDNNTYANTKKKSLYSRLKTFLRR